MSVSRACSDFFRVQNVSKRPCGLKSGRPENVEIPTFSGPRPLVPPVGLEATLPVDAFRRTDLGKQAFTALQTPLLHEPSDREADFLFECAGKVVFVRGAAVRDDVEAQFFRKVLIDVPQRRSHDRRIMELWFRQCDGGALIGAHQLIEADHRFHEVPTIAQVVTELRGRRSEQWLHEPAQLGWVHGEHTIDGCAGRRAEAGFKIGVCCGQRAQECRVDMQIHAFVPVACLADDVVHHTGIDHEHGAWFAADRLALNLELSRSIEDAVDFVVVMGVEAQPILHMHKGVEYLESVRGHRADEYGRPGVGDCSVTLWHGTQRSTYAVAEVTGRSRSVAPCRGNLSWNNKNGRRRRQ